jgi:transcriptional regulator with XRE-family HTH domain
MDEFVGRGLIEMLRARMGKDDLSLTQLAKRLQVGGSYLSQLSRGVKPLTSVSEQFLRSCAEYLDKPVVLSA